MLAPMPDWSRIKDGPRFQALACALLVRRFPEEHIVAFDRLGRDDGLDAVSSDGATIYQAKFVGSRRFSDLRHEIERELKAIPQRRISSSHWTNARRWVLLTNIQVNPSDVAKWKSDFEPRFKQLGLEPNALWANDLEQWLIDFPGVDREYFGERGRCFCSLSEAKVIVEVDPARIVEFVDREAEEAKFTSFLHDSTKTFLEVRGAPGIGKTRFLLDVALQCPAGLDVHWGLAEQLERTEDWLGAIAPERPAVLVLDDVSRSLIDHLIEQMRARRIENWKIIATARPGESPLFSAKMRHRGPVEQLDLDPLSRSASEQLYKSLVAQIGRWPDLPASLLIDRVLRFAEGSPFWLSEVLERWRENGNNDPAAFRREYARQTVTTRLDPLATDLGMTGAQAREILGWIALYQPVNREDSTLLDFLARQCGTIPEATLKLVEALITARLLCRRGRLFEMVPEALRLAFVADLLTTEDGTISNLGAGIKGLLLRSFEDDYCELPHRDRLMHAIGVVQRLDGKPEAALLREVANRVLAEARKASTPSQQRRWIEAGRVLSGSNPSVMAELVGIIRTRPTDREVIETPWGGNKTVSHKDVVEDLGWPLFEAAAAAPEQARVVILREMIELVGTQAAYAEGGPTRRNDGKGAVELLARIVRGEAEFSAEYVDEAARLASTRLKASADESATPEDLARLRAIAKPLLAAERRDHWSAGNQYHFTIGAVQPESREGKIRSGLREMLWDLLNRDRDAAVRCLWWELLVFANHSAASSNGLPGGGVWATEAVDDLHRVDALLKKRPLTTEEFRYARELWARHLRHANSEDGRSLAIELENLFARENQLEWFVQGDEPYRPEVWTEIRARAFEWLRSVPLSDVDQLLTRARALPDHELNPRLSALADALGEKALTSDPARKSILQFLSDSRAERLHFAVEAAARWLAWARERSPSFLDQILHELLRASATGRLQVLRRVYEHSMFTITADECRVLAEVAEELDVNSESSLAFALIGRIFGTTPERAKQLVPTWTAKLDPANTARCFDSLVDAIWMEHVARKSKLAPPDWRWLLSQLEWVSDWDDVQHGMTIHHLTDLQDDRSDRLTLPWLVDLLVRRDDRFIETTDREQRILVIPLDTTLLQLVATPQEVPVAPDVRTALERLVDRQWRSTEAEHALPWLVARLDPSGIVVPEYVATQLRQIAAPDRKNTYRWGRFAGHYRERSPGWTTIAKAVCEAAWKSKEEDPRSFYSLLRWSEPEAWWGSDEGLHPRWQRVVDAAQRALDETPDGDPLRDYFEWSLEVARETLASERQRFEEEHR